MTIQNILKEIEAHFSLYPKKLYPSEFVGVNRTITIERTTADSDTMGKVDVSFFRLGNEKSFMSIDVSLINGGILLDSHGTSPGKGSAFFLRRSSADLVELTIVGICAAVNEDKYSMGKHYSERAKAHETFLGQVSSFEKMGLLKQGEKVYDQFNSYTIRNINQNFTFDLFKESDAIITNHNGFTLANMLNVRDRNKQFKDLKSTTTFSPVYNSDVPISKLLTRAHTALLNALRDEHGSLEIVELPSSNNTLAVASLNGSFASIISNDMQLLTLENDDKARLLAIMVAIKSNHENNIEVISFLSNSDQMSTNIKNVEVTGPSTKASMTLF